MTPFPMPLMTPPDTKTYFIFFSTMILSFVDIWVRRRPNSQAGGEKRNAKQVSNILIKKCRTRNATRRRHLRVVLIVDKVWHVII